MTRKEEGRGNRGKPPAGAPPPARRRQENPRAPGTAPRGEEDGRTIARQEREIYRLRSSVSLRLGVHLTSAVRDPRRLLLLPVTFPHLALRLGWETLGRKTRARAAPPAPAAPPAARPARGGPARGEETPPPPRSHSIVLFPTNGVGFGHFTRLYAVARRLRVQDPDLEIVFFTPMPALHIPHADGFVTYHLSGRSKGSAMSAATWNRMLREMLALVFEAHRPRWFVFDGVNPYPGLLHALGEQAATEKIWLRRGILKNSHTIPAGSQDGFDWIVHPGDAAAAAPPAPARDGPRVLHVSPITLIEEHEMWSREKARRRLGLPPGARAVYVQLGAGRINDIHAEMRRVLDALLAHQDVHVVVGESMLGRRLDISRHRVRTLLDYPNALYLKAFDASVQAGGYNSFHEMRSLRLPTLFLPNPHTGQDDQAARCRVAEEEGWGLVNLERRPERIRYDISRLLSLETPPAQAPPACGATELCRAILSGPGPGPRGTGGA